MAAFPRLDVEGWEGAEAPSGPFTFDEEEEEALLLAPQRGANPAAAPAAAQKRPPLQHTVSRAQLNSEHDDSWPSYRHEAAR